VRKADEEPETPPDAMFYFVIRGRGVAEVQGGSLWLAIFERIRATAMEVRKELGEVGFGFVKGGFGTAPMRYTPSFFAAASENLRSQVICVVQTSGSEFS
jgi:hypothetical protein